MDASSHLLQLKGCTFRWKHNQPQSIESTTRDSIPQTTRRVLGFIAQDMEQQFPEAVHTSTDGWLVVEYSSIVPCIVETLKQHSEDLDNLQTQTLTELMQSTQSLSVTLQEVRSDSGRRIVSDRSGAKAATKARSWPGSSASSWSRLCPPPISKCQGLLLLIVIAAIVLIALALGVGLTTSSLGGTSPQASPSAPYQPTAINFTPRNYISDGGFEDNSDTSWSEAEILTYSQSIFPPGALIKSSAPFEAGLSFLLFNSSKTASTAQTLLGPANKIRVSAWIFLSQNYSGQSSKLMLSVERLASNVNDSDCSATAQPNLDLVMVWQQIVVGLACQSGNANGTLYHVSFSVTVISM